MSSPQQVTGSEAFMPDAQFGMQAQQELITQLRAQIATGEEQRAYLRAVMLQMQAEAQAGFAERDAQIAAQHDEVENLRRLLDGETGENDPETPSPDFAPQGSSESAQEVPDGDLPYGDYVKRAEDRREAAGGQERTVDEELTNGVALS